MRKSILPAMLMVTVFAAQGWAASGATLFKQHCASCHPDGGNIVNPKKTLHKKDMDREGVKGWQTVVAKMRSPGPGMTHFDAKAIPDKDAKAIAQYVIKTFFK